MNSDEVAGNMAAAAAAGVKPARHVFTVDVEEWFQVSAFERWIHPREWDSLPSRVEPATDRLLALLAEYDSVGTFFVLGWVAERRPELVRRIAAAGHEVASHGYAHRRVTTLTASEFRDDVRRGREVLERIIGQRVLGYRAPSFSIVPDTEWAFDVLLDEGFLYDSSIFPIRRSRGYGFAGAPDIPHLIERSSGALRELPLTPLRLAGVGIPAAGGAYFRHLPYSLTRATLRQRARRGEAGVFYLHPWELDPDQPRVASTWLTRWRHYGGIARTEVRLRRLLREFSFTSAARALALVDAPQPTLAPAGGALGV